MAEISIAPAEQFDDLEQQQESSNLGMWVFLATEIMFFGGMFMAYTVYRHSYPQGFGEASRHMDLLLGSINTAVLLTSSLMMALAVHAAQLGLRRTLILFIVLTMLLGCVFLGIKFTEYYQKYEEHYIPGHDFRFEGPHAKEAEMFIGFYFVMTGMHALHMIIGLGLMTALLLRARRNEFSRAYFSPVEVTGLYWHFVDIVWIFLFPILYLVDRHH
jgi:cytochrome c oxidase subunit III